MTLVSLANTITPTFANVLKSQASPAQIAKQILADTQIGPSSHHIDQIASGLENVAQSDPTKEANVRAEVIKGLSPAEQGELSRESDQGGKADDCVDRSYVSASKVRDIIIKATDSEFNPSNYYTISAHADHEGLRGVPNTSHTSNPEAQAKALIADIRAHGWDGKKPIMALACNFGNSDKVVKAVARLAGVPVIAATNLVKGTVGWSSAKQSVTTDDGRPNGGRFLQFNPNGQVHNPFCIEKSYAVVAIEYTMKNGNPVLTPTIVPLNSLVK
jgi:hypothetical protein